MNAGVHQKVNSDNFIERRHAESVDAGENREEEVTEDHCPKHAHCRTQGLDLQLREATGIY